MTILHIDNININPSYYSFSTTNIIVLFKFSTELDMINNKQWTFYYKLKKYYIFVKTIQFGVGEFINFYKNKI